MSAIAPIARSSRLGAAPRGLLRLRSDQTLAERFAGGDDAAFAVLYERHRSSVLAVCIGVLGDQHDAEDAAQEVFTALAVALKGERPRELRAWLVRVARNAAIDAARRRRPGATDEELASHRHAPDSSVKAELESVLAGIRQLPESQRTALLMRELAGHSYQEIAMLLETDEEGVRGLIARARIGLRNYREAAELPCAAARTAMVAEPDGRRHDKVVRRHMRRCASCQAYRKALRSDAKALRALDPAVPIGGLAGGGAVVGMAAKGALAGGALSQVGAACAVSICSVGGLVLLAPHPSTHELPRLGGHVVRHGAAHRPVGSASRRRAAAVRAGAGTSTRSAGSVSYSAVAVPWEPPGARGAGGRSGRTRPMFQVRGARAGHRPTIGAAHGSGVAGVVRPPAASATGSVGDWGGSRGTGAYGGAGSGGRGHGYGNGQQSGGRGWSDGRGHGWSGGSGSGSGSVRNSGRQPESPVASDSSDQTSADARQTPDGPDGSGHRGGWDEGGNGRSSGAAVTIQTTTGPVGYVIPGSGLGG